MYRKFFRDKLFYGISSIFLVYNIFFNLNDKFNFITINTKSAIYSPYVILYLYVPLTLILLLNNILKYKQYIYYVRGKKVFIKDNILYFNQNYFFIILILFLFSTDIVASIKVSINLLFVSNIFLLFTIMSQYFIYNKILRLFPIYIYFFEVVLFQIAKKGIFIHYNLPLLSSLPLYIFAIASILFLNSMLYRECDLYA